ncbi:SBBP repeat-containing protein [uncultured Arcticibacterium sp.]|uniref:SBBP repeat-containing protein n=1 Tax=uncultured Arcticibacterium sp. TaxID=2173042 RepID=UPI0030FA39A6
MSRAILLLLALSSKLVFAQKPTLIEERAINGLGFDIEFTLLAMPDSGFMAAGVSSSRHGLDKKQDSFTEDLWLLKFDKNFNVIWEKIIGGSGQDWPREMCFTNDGNIVIACRSNSGISGDKSESSRGGVDFWVIKIDLSGNIIWDKTIGGDNYDDARSIAATPDGGVVLAGYSNSNQSFEKSENQYGNYDYWVVKLNNNGVLVWEKTLGGDGFDFVNDILVDTNGDVYVGGYSWSNAGGTKSQNPVYKRYADFWVVKLNLYGQMVWDRTIGSYTKDDLTSMCFSSDNNLLLAGYSGASIAYGDKSDVGRGKADFWLIKINKNGNKLWDKTYGGGQSDFLRTVVSKGAYIYLVGSSESGISGEKTEALKGHDDLWLLKLDQNGSVLWDFSAGSNSYDEVRSMIIDMEGNIIVSANILDEASGDRSQDSYDWDGWVTKIKECNIIPGPTDLAKNLIKGEEVVSFENCHNRIPLWFSSYISTKPFFEGLEYTKSGGFAMNTNFYIKCKENGCLSEDYGDLNIDILCPESLVLSEISNLNNYSISTIESNARLEDNANLFSGSYILLKPGFDSNDNIFHAEIEACLE